MNPSESEEQPFVGRLVQPESESGSVDGTSDGDSNQVEIAESEREIREGSPFRQDPVFPAGERRMGPSYADLGPFRYTAMGAASAAVLVLVFAGAGSWWFPVGGLLVAILGAVLSIVGLFARSRFRLVSALSLVLHVGFFMVSYVRSLT